MSSSTETKLQKRPLDTHVQQGNRLLKVCFPRSTEVDLRQTYPTPRKVDRTHAPTAQSLPLDPAPVKEMTEHQHVATKRATAYPMSRGRRKLGNRTTADEVVTTQTRVTGKEKRNGWRVMKPTAKTAEARAKAQAWMAKHGGKVKVR